jgi:hypothetical protein
MRRLSVMMTVLVIAVLGGCSRAPEGGSKTLTVSGRVLEQVDGPPYTYLRLKTKTGETWAAVPLANVGKDSTVTITNAVLLKDFDTGLQGRRFDVVFGTLER